MTLTLTDEHYRRLLMLITLGEWMVNANRKEPDPEYEGLAAKIYGAAPGTPNDSFVEFDDELGTWTSSEALHEEAHALIDEYDDATFWEELPSRLAERDLIAEQGERAVQAMRPDDRIRALKSIVRDYAEEFEREGLGRVGILEG